MSNSEFGIRYAEFPTGQCLLAGGIFLKKYLLAGAGIFCINVEGVSIGKIKPAQLVAEKVFPSLPLWGRGTVEDGG